MSKLTGTALIVAGLATAAFAGAIRTPEIDGATAVSALALIAGATLVIRARKK